MGGRKHGLTAQYCEPNIHNHATCNTILSYTVNNQQLNNLHPKNYNKKHEKMQHMVVIDKLSMTCSYAELNFKLQHISSFFVHHPPTTIKNLLDGM